MRVLITGGTGFVGSALSQALVEAGDTVAITTRGAKNPDVAPDALQYVWDYKQSAPPAEALDGVQAVVHLLGANIAQGRWTPARKRELYDSRIVSTCQLVSALPPSVKVFLSASAVACYPSSVHASYTERWVEAGNITGSGPGGLHAVDKRGGAFLAGMCSDWEGEAAKAGRGRREVRLRIGLVLGPGGFLGRLLPIFRLGLGGPLGDGRQWVSWIHIRDLVDLITYAIEHEALSGPVNATAPNPVTSAQFARTLGQVIKRPAFFPVPGFALKLAMGEASEIALSSQRVLPEKALASGFSFGFPDLSQALDDLIAR